MYKRRTLTVKNKRKNHSTDYRRIATYINGNLGTDSDRQTEENTVDSVNKRMWYGKETNGMGEHNIVE